METSIDCCGLQCPLPVVACRDIIEKSSPAKLTVLVDNLASLENVRLYLAKQGYNVTANQKSTDKWQIEAVKTKETALPEITLNNNSKTLVLLTTETLGRGDEELGKKLMETFLATLAEIQPWRIILLNGAVKLAAMQGAALESLKKLSANGTTILVCGTCLSYYNLLEKKETGETTNMMDVITSLQIAEKVIRP